MISLLVKVLAVGIPIIFIGCTSSRQAPVVDLGDSAFQTIVESPERTALLDDSSEVEVNPVPLEIVQGRALPEDQPRHGPDSTNPAIVALLNSASSHATVGQYDAASVSVERALQIEPDNAQVWHRLAKIRLAQGQLEEAASLAVRSNTLAGNNRVLLAENWRLIGIVRDRSGDAPGAKAAILRADEYGGVLN